MTETTNIIFVKGPKQAIVDFVNRGLKGCNSKVRISIDMSGEQMTDRLNGHGCPISMRSYLPMSASIIPMDLWRVKYETADCLCLSFQLIDAPDCPVSFLKYLNGLDGVTVYAYGFHSYLYSSWYQYNGRKDEVMQTHVPDDPKFEEYKEALKTQSDYNPNTVDAEAGYKVLEGYVQDFLKELNAEWTGRL